MTRAQTLLGGLLAGLLCAAAGGGIVWLLVVGRSEGKKPTTATIPATVPRPLKEDQVNTFTLNPEAVERLALRTGTVEKKPVRMRRVYGGEIAIPPGHAVVVSAPLGGSLRAPAGGLPRVGGAVTRGQAILQLSPLLSPEGLVTLTATRIEAEGLMKNAQTQLEAARVALERATRLLQGDAGSKRAVDEAQAQYDLAKKSLEAATARHDLLRKAVGELDKGTGAPITIESPTTGMLRNVSALPGQNVPTGAALFEVIDLDRVWVRVPVYVDDLREVDPAADAIISGLTARPGDVAVPARPVTAPPSANPAAGTVDLFYEFDNRKTQFSPARRVGANLSLKGDAVSLTVPWSAVIHDIHGNTWVYEQIEERTYARRRVGVRFVSGETAVLAFGPPEGTSVVIAGAAELFGTETGFSK